MQMWQQWKLQQNSRHINCNNNKTNNKLHKIRSALNLIPPIHSVDIKARLLFARLDSVTSERATNGGTSAKRK